MANVKGAAEAAKNVAVKKAEETKAAVKTAAKAVETKAEEVKAEAAKAETKVAAAVKAEAEKVAPAKKEEAPVKKEAAPVKDDKKKPGRKPGSKAKAAKKEESHPEIFVQYGPGESSVGAVVERIRNEYVEQGHRLSSIKSLKVYLKPEDRSAYYVINDKVAGRVDLF